MFSLYGVGKRATPWDDNIKDLVIASDGTKYTNHKYPTRSEKKLARRQHRLSRKPKGSRNPVAGNKICEKSNKKPGNGLPVF